MVLPGGLAVPEIISFGSLVPILNKWTHMVNLDALLFTGSFLRKSVVFAYLGLIQHLKDLQRYFVYKKTHPPRTLPHRGTLLTRNTLTLGPHRRRVPRILGGS